MMKYNMYRAIPALMMAGAFSLALAACGNGGNTASTGTDSAASGSTTSTMSSGSTAPAMPSDTGKPATAPASQGMSDQDFITKATAANMAEINAHKAAASHAMSADVKSLAKHMLADHEKLGADVKAYAAKKKLTTSTEPPADKKQMLDDMNANKKGKDWDAAYLDAQESDHKEVIAMFESAEGSVSDPELKDMIAKTIPQLKMHLQMVQDTKSKMK